MVAGAAAVGAGDDSLKRSRRYCRRYCRLLTLSAVVLCGPTAFCCLSYNQPPRARFVAFQRSMTRLCCAVLCESRWASCWASTRAHGDDGGPAAAPESAVCALANTTPASKSCQGDLPEDAMEALWFGHVLQNQSRLAATVVCIVVGCGRGTKSTVCLSLPVEKSLFGPHNARVEE